MVRYIERTHKLTLAGLVCEYVQDYRGDVHLTAVLRTEWATLGITHAGKLVGANLTGNGKCF